MLGRPTTEPDILIVRLTGDGCIDGYDCEDIIYKGPDATRLTTGTKDVVVTTPSPQVSVRAYPNPSSGQMIIALDQRYSKIAIGIYDIQGALVQTYYDLSSDKVELNLSHLPSGTYIYKIYDGRVVVKTGEWIRI